MQVTLTWQTLITAAAVLYERVTGQFLNGNGEFVAGADVAWDWEAA